MRSGRFFLAMTCSVLGATLASGCGQAAGMFQAQGNTRFTRDPARFKANQEKLVAATRQQNPQAADALQRVFAQDMMAMLAPELRRLGLDVDDMADMTAAYWVTAWEASNGIVGRETDPALVKGARDQLARTMGASAGRMDDGQKQDLADMMLLQALIVDARMKAAAKGGPAAQKQMSDAVHGEASQLLKVDLRQVELTPSGFGGAGATSAPPAAGKAPAAANAGNWGQVEGVYFKSYTTFGVGGMMISDFEPIILFRDGSYYEVEGEALEDMDLAASRRAEPRNWGKWRKQGATFLLTDEKGKTHDHQLQQGSFFKAFPAEATNGKLARPYKRISGGGNSAIGGTMAIAAQTNMNFSPDGRFTTGSNMGAVGANVSAYSRKPAQGVGRYRIERHTITFTNPDGSTRREFFALGSQGSPARLDTDMIFIGDRVFVKDD